MRHCKNILRDDKGITLIELIVCIAILGIVALLVGGYMKSGSKNYTRGTTLATIQKDIQVITDHIAETMQECQDIVTITIPIESGDVPGEVNHAYLLKKTSLAGVLILYKEKARILSRRTIVYTEADLTGTTIESKVESDPDMTDMTKMTELCSNTLGFEITLVTGNANLYSIYMKLGDDEVTTDRKQQVRLRNG